MIAASIWPQWRGPHRDGRTAATAPWPEKLTPEVLVRSWRVELGPSYSGPVVSDSLVFVTETVERDREVVRALDRATGAERWQVSWPGAMTVPFFAKANGDWIRATPAFDGRSLYVAGMRDVLVAIDVASGTIRWRVDFVEQLGTPLPDFGFVSSPLVVDDCVYVQAGASVCKLDKASGKILWRALEDGGGTFGSAFSSPRIGELAGRQQLLVQTRTKLAGLDPERGEVLWSKEIPAFRGMNILTPTIAGDSIFTSAYGGKSFLLACQRDGEKCVVREAWTSPVTGYMSSPLVIGDHVYLHLRNRRFTCLDLATGATRWTTEPFGEYWSMVANGDRILALDERGELRLIRATPEKFELLDSRTVSEEPCWAHLAVCGDEVLVRELNGLTAFRWRAAP
ncbi:MAG: PQQ-binding-like beta-propeller repeat protein [Pirellulales bacterium]